MEIRLLAYRHRLLFDVVTGQAEKEVFLHTIEPLESLESIAVGLDDRATLDAVDPASGQLAIRAYLNVNLGETSGLTGSLERLSQFWIEHDCYPLAGKKLPQRKWHVNTWERDKQDIRRRSVEILSVVILC
jgi:hypothetical protein